MKIKLSHDSSKPDNQKKKNRGMDQWKALVTSFLMQSLTLGTLESFGALYVPIMDTLLKDDTRKNSKAALIGSLTTGFLMGFSPVSSMLIDKVGAQLIALFGGVIVFMATLISSFVKSFYLMALFYGVIFGIGCSMLFIASNVVISRYFPENSTVAYGILGLGNGLMNSIMPHVISHCVDSIKLAGTIRIICCLLSSIMFFPLYWSSYVFDQEGEPVIAYIPARIVSTKSFKIQDEIIIEVPNKRVSNILKNPVIRHNLVDEKDQNENCNTISQIYGSGKSKRKRFFIDSEKFSRFIRPNSCNNNLNASNLKEEVIHENDNEPFKNLKQQFIVKKEGTSDDKRNLDRTDNLTPHDYAIPTSSIFQKQITSRTSTYLIEGFKVSSKDTSNTSSRTRDQLLTILKNMKCCQAEVFRSKQYVTLLFAMFISMFGYQVPNVHIVKFAQEISPSYNGQLLLTCLGGSSAIGPFINGIIMDRYNCRLTKYRLYQIFVLGYGIVILTLTITTNYSILIIVCLFIGFLDGSFSSLIGPLAIDLVGVHNAGQAIGIYFGVISPAVMTAPPLAGLIYESFTSYKYAFFGAGLFFLIGGLLLSISHSTTKHSNSQVTRGDFTTNVFLTQTSELIEITETSETTDQASIISTTYENKKI